MSELAILEAIGVTKRYGAVTAVDNLTLAIQRGGCLGLLGPNGAGKTTLVEIIEGIIAPTAGQVLYEGHPRSASFRENIGIMFQQTALFGFMSVEETLRTFQALYPRTLEIEPLIQLCHLDETRKQMNDKISGGQRQRLLLALALINRPELLFLDEPSTGLDPQARRNLWDIVQNVKREGKTIILTTHSMEEAQQLCDLVAIMDHGRIISHGSPAELIARHTRGIRIILPAESICPLPLDGIGAVETQSGRSVLRVNEMNVALKALIEANIDLSRMVVETPTLETVFLNLTGRQLRD
jgi:ABC-2 type transport system ATP-binding protein